MRKLATKPITKAKLQEKLDQTKKFLDNLLIWLDDNLEKEQKERFCKHFDIKTPDLLVEDTKPPEILNEEIQSDDEITKKD